MGPESSGFRGPNVQLPLPVAVLSLGEPGPPSHAGRTEAWPVGLKLVLPVGKSEPDDEV